MERMSDDGVKNATAGGVLIPGAGPAIPLEVLTQVEIKSGLRCQECGERIAKGWRYTWAEPTVIEGTPLVVLGSASLCERPTCEGIEKSAQLDPICRERLEIEWLDTPRPEPADSSAS